MSTRAASPFLVVVSAPSGAGKTTLCSEWLQRDSRLRYSISCTTRTPRDGEIDGHSYHFLTRDEFERRIAANGFLEWAEVYGHLYGTLRETVESFHRDGYDVLMDVDVQGARLIRDALKRLPTSDPLSTALVDIFIAPPSMEELRSRIESRAKDHPEVIERRMAEAVAEMAAMPEYSHTVVNHNISEALDQLQAILTAARSSWHRVPPHS